MRRALYALALTIASPVNALAEPARATHYGAGFGGYSAITGPAAYGPAAEIEVYPGGAFGRFGARIEGRGFEAFENGWVTGGVTYEAGASRPRLVLAVHAEAGATYGEPVCPVGGAGVHVQLFLVGPLAIGLDSTATVIYAGIDSTLVLGTAATIRIAR